MFAVIQCDREKTPHKLVKERTKQQVLHHISIIDQAHTEKKKKELRTTYGVKEGYNPLFTLNVDLFR